MRRLALSLALCLGTAAAAAQPPPSSAGAFAMRHGAESFTVECADGEPMRACAEAAGALLDRLHGARPGPPALPAPDSSAGATPTATGTGPDVTPTIWMQPSPTVDPTRLPLGDHRMVTDAPRKGYVFACDPFMYSMTTIIGAQRTGPWVDQQSGTYDVTRKVFDRGRVEWAGRFSAVPNGAMRMISGNGLPIPGVPTGTFPVPVGDPAFQFDRNPFALVEQPVAFAVPLDPVAGPAPRCVYKEVGITLDGVALHTGLDSSGRDENAYELNDTCGGKPQPGGLYHRSVMSDCTPGIHDRATVVGYALDGFPITTAYAADGTELTTDTLDECHGTTSEITWDGRKVTTYHYVFTRDFPYSVGCFKGTPTRSAFPPLPGAPPQTR